MPPTKDSFQICKARPRVAVQRDPPVAVSKMAPSGGAGQLDSRPTPPDPPVSLPGAYFLESYAAATTSISTSQSLDRVCATMPMVGMTRPFSAFTRALAFSSA